MVEEHIKNLIDERFGLNDKQRLAALERQLDVVVTAGAGSGKTLTLVARYTSLLAEGISPRRIAAITFSIKAAREMRARVRTKLMELLANESDPIQRERWMDLSAQMDSARIGTIHSLCMEILRSHPAEAGIDPRSEVVDEGLSAALRQQACEDTLKLMAEDEHFEPLLYNIPIRDLTTMLCDLLNDRLEAGAAFDISIDQGALVERTLHNRMRHPLIHNIIQDLEGMTQAELQEDAGATLASMVNDLLELWHSAEDLLEQKDVIGAASLLYEIRRSKMNARPGKGDSEAKKMVADLRELFDKLINPLTGGAGSQDPIPTAESEALADDLIPLLRDAFEMVRQAYQESLDARQAIDFDDMEGRSLQLLRREEIRRYWQNQLDAVLVDEFQDTNHRQREIVEALTGSPGKLFIVGDMRQSIYRFRQADVTVFSEVQEEIRKEGGLLVDLDLTYRAHQPLLNGMGDLLSEIIGTHPDPARPYYVPFTTMVARDEQPPKNIQPPHIEFILGAGEDAEQAHPRAARALAQRLLQLKYQERQITQWDDVALLFRASTGYSDYEEAFQEAGIPYVTVAGRGFYDRPEIRDLLNILRALADPQDDLAFAGLLRSPAFGLSDAALYLLQKKDQGYYKAIQGDLSQLDEFDRARAERTLKILRNLLPFVDRIPVAELIKKVVDALNYRSLLAFADNPLDQYETTSTGGRLYRNLDKLMEDALASQQVSVRNYLEMIKTLNDAGAREGEAASEAEGAVSLMTIHKAKGLEYKVVVLAAAGRGIRSPGELAYLNKDLGVSLKLDPPPMLYNLAKQQDKDQEKAEELRVLYVALTRAKHKLIISSHTTRNKKGELTLTAWAKDLAEAADLKPTRFQQAAGESFEGQTASGEPFYAWCALEDSFSWERHELDRDEQMEIELDTIPLYPPINQETQVPEEIEGSIDPDSWRATSVQTAVPGKVLGEMVHKAIQRWLFPDDPQLETLLETTAIHLGLVSEVARKEAIHKSTNLLARLQAHPLWREINTASARYHELPYTYQSNNQFENRKIDLLYQDGKGWHIIDFKTDPIDDPEHADNLLNDYGLQVRRYKKAVWDLLRIQADARICFLDDQDRISMYEV